MKLNQWLMNLNKQPKYNGGIMSQSRKDSMLEAWVNIAFGAIVAWIITYTATTYVDDTKLAATISVIGCTVWSFIRQYFVRRYFNARIKSSEL